MGGTWALIRDGGMRARRHTAARKVRHWVTTMRSVPHILVINDTKVRQPVFVLGAPHSGMDLLARALKRSTGFHLTAGRPDVLRVTYAFARRPAIAADRERAAARVLRDAYADAWRISPRACAECSAECRLLGGVTGPGACVEPQTVRRFADASPDLLYSADVLLEAFPDAQLLQVIRDGRDVVGDMLDDDRCLTWFKPGFANLDDVFPNPFLGVEDETERHRWASASVAVKCALRWRSAIRLSAWLRARTPAAQLFTVRYEDLITRPGRVAPDLSAYLGIQVSKVTLSGLIRAAGRENGEHAVGSWKSRLSDRQARQVERVAGRELTRLGYPLATAAPTRPAPQT
jgi:Sulfotransferase family